MKIKSRISFSLLLTILICSCSKDKTTPPSFGTVTDIDGNVYNTVTIGTQIWMIDNLRALHYNNGDTIQNLTDDSQWAGTASGAYCWYGNEETQHKSIYGALYNYYAVADIRNICPADWRVPALADWNILQSYLGGNTVAGGKMKEAGNTHWYAPNDGANNESNFLALPGGDRVPTGPFELIGQLAEFWSLTDPTASTAYVFFQSFETGQLYSNQFDKKFGLSVRCIK